MDMPQPAAAVINKKSLIINRLREVLAAEHVISDPHETRAYECDALTAYACQPLCVVLPGTTREVSAVL